MNLISLLQLLDFDVSCLPKNGLFKTPDKKLFHELFCFLVSKVECFPEKKLFLKTYSNYLIATTNLSAGYRSSIVEIVNKLNSLFPEMPIRAIGHSYIKVPQGEKVVSFLFDTAKTVLFSISKSMGEPYIPPTSEAEIQEFLSSHDVTATPVELKKQLDELELKKDSLESQVTNQINNFYSSHIKLVESSSVDTEFKEKLIKALDNETEFKIILQDSQNKIDSFENTVQKYENINSTMNTVLKNLFIIQQLKKLSVELKTVLDESCDSNSEKFDLQSLLMSCVKKVSDLKEYLGFDNVMPNHTAMLALKSRLDEELSDLKMKISNAKEINEKFSPLVKDYFENEFDKISNSQETTDLLIIEFMNSCNAPPIQFEGEEIPLPNVKLPVSPTKLAEWITGDLTKKICPSSVKKNSVKSLGGTPKLSKMLNANKQTWLKSGAKNLLPQKFNLEPLVGLPLNRRATIASPMAQKELNRMKRRDKTEPFKPMVAKFLFPTSSSPINESKQLTCFGDESTINKTSTCSPDLNVSDLIKSCKLKNNSVDDSFNVSKEILLWNDSSSDSDLDLCNLRPRDPPPTELNSSSSNDDN